MEKNVIDLLKEQIIPEVEFGFDFCSRLVNEILKKYPEARYNVNGAPSCIKMMITPHFELEIYPMDRNCDELTSFILLHSCDQTTLDIPRYYKDAKLPGIEESQRTRYSQYRLLNLSYGKYVKTGYTNLNDRDSDETVQMVNFIKSIIMKIDNEIDKDGTKLEFHQGPDSPYVY